MSTIARPAIVGMVAVAAMAGSATAQTRSSYTVPEFKSILSQAGLSPKIIKDEAKGPRAIQGRVKSDKDTFTFFVRGKECKGAPPACETYIFFANWDLGRDVTPADFRIVNKFNDTNPYGRAYALEAKRRVGVDYVVELRGRVTRDYIIAPAKRWSAVIRAFVVHCRKNLSKK